MTDFNANRTNLKMEFLRFGLAVCYRLIASYLIVLHVVRILLLSNSQNLIFCGVLSRSPSSSHERQRMYDQQFDFIAFHRSHGCFSRGLSDAKLVRRQCIIPCELLDLEVTLRSVLFLHRTVSRTGNIRPLFAHRFAYHTAVPISFHTPQRFPFIRLIGMIFE